MVKRMLGGLGQDEIDAQLLMHALLGLVGRVTMEAQFDEESVKDQLREWLDITRGTTELRKLPPNLLRGKGEEWPL